MAEVNVGLRQALRSLTKVEAELINDSTRKKLEHLRAKIAKKIRRPGRDVTIEFGRGSAQRSDQIIFEFQVSIAPDKKHRHGFSVSRKFRTSYRELREADDRRTFMQEKFVDAIREMVDEVDVEYSQGINCPRFKCFGKAARVAPAIPRQFLCDKCGSITIECPKCREVSTFRMPGVHRCEDCDWPLAVGDGVEND